MTVPVETISRAKASRHGPLAPVMHLDGCHWYRNTYECLTCGGAIDVQGERQMREGYGPVWALDDCDRCNALLAGARRHGTLTQFAPPSSPRASGPCHRVPA